MEEKIAVKNLREIKEILGKIRVEYWLDHGTLLGAVRDGKIIEWDRDIDLGTMYESTKQIVSAFPEFKKRGFSVFLHKYKSIVSIHRFGYDVGISLYRLKGDDMWMRSIAGEKLITKTLFLLLHLLSIRVRSKSGRIFIPKNLKREKLRLFSIATSYYLVSLLPRSLRQSLRDLVWSFFKRTGGKILLLSVPKRHIEKLGTIRFYGMIFNVPSNVERYLECGYGSDWKTPKKKWIFYKDDGRINKKSSCPRGRPMDLRPAR